ncbi:hypothetical protein [Roseovarius sp. D0-M9]
MNSVDAIRAVGSCPIMLPWQLDDGVSWSMNWPPFRPDTLA